MRLRRKSTIRRADEGSLIGDPADGTRRFAGRRLASRNRFVAFEEGRYVQFEIPDGWLTGEASYRTEPSPGGTLLTSRMEFRAHGFAALL